MPLKDKYLKYTPEITLEIFTLVCNKLIENGINPSHGESTATKYYNFSKTENYLQLNGDGNCFECYKEDYGLNETTVQEILEYNPLVKDEFVLPEKWYIKTTKDSNKLICDWIDSKIKSKSKSDRSIGNYFTSDYKGWMHYAPEGVRGYKEITFDQFKTYVLKETIEKPKSIEKWSVGSYVVFLENNIQSNDYNKGDICEIGIAEKSSIRYKSGFQNNIDGKFSVADKLKWFATKSEAEEFAKTLVEPAKEEYPLTKDEVIKTNPRFKVGKWYYNSDKTFAKASKICTHGFDIDEIILNGVYFKRKDYWGIHNNMREASIEEIQQYLPNEHPDLIKTNQEFKIGEYIILENAGGWSYSSCNNGCLGLITKIGDYIPGFLKNCTYSVTGKILNSNNNDKTFKDIPVGTYNNKIIIRHATPEEINNHLSLTGKKDEPLHYSGDLESMSITELHEGGLVKEFFTSAIGMHKAIPEGDLCAFDKFSGIKCGGLYCDDCLLYKNNRHRLNDLLGLSVILDTYGVKTGSVIPTTGNCYDKGFSTSIVPGPLKLILSVNDEELPMVNIIKTNTIKQLLNND